METVLLNVKNILVYIDDLLIHTSTHDEHLQVLEKVFQRLEQNHLKVNLDKCFFGNQEVSYLGFTLTPQGIKPGRNKLQAIKDTKLPTNIKMVRSFVSLCNFFRSHIKDFATIAAPLFKSHKERFRLQNWSFASRCITRFQNPSTTASIRSSHGLSPS